MDDQQRQKSTDSAVCKVECSSCGNHWHWLLLNTAVCKVFLQQAFLSGTLGAMRMKMFINCAIDNLRKLPPSEGALLLHSKRATQQAGYLWKESESDITIPNPELWGWFRNDRGVLLPQWEHKASSFSIADITMTCSCRKHLCKKCKCAKAKLPCLPFCIYMRECSNTGWKVWIVDWNSGYSFFRYFYLVDRIPDVLLFPAR